MGEVGEGSLADEWGRWRGCSEERDFSRMRFRRVSQNADGYAVVAAESTMLISFSFCIWGCRVRIKETVGVSASVGTQKLAHSRPSRTDRSDWCPKAVSPVLAIVAGSASHTGLTGPPCPNRIKES